MFGTLRHDYDGLDGAAVGPDGRADAYVGLQQAVVPSLAGTMKGKNHRPFVMRRPVLRDEYLIFETDGLDGNSAVDEAGFVFLGVRKGWEQQEQEQKCSQCFRKNGQRASRG